MDKGEFPIKNNKLISYIIIACILCSTFIPSIQISEAAPTQERKIQFPILYGLGWLIGQLIPIISFADAYKADPSNITIGYNENVTIRVGVVDMTTGEFAPPFYLTSLTAHYLSFSAEFPQGNPGGAWFVNFNPPLVYQNTATDLLVTNATISLTTPPSSTNPIQSSLIRIKIINMWVAGNFWFAGDQPGYEKIYKKLFWFLGAITAGYGKLSGKVLPEEIYVDVLVNVKPYHAVKIQPLPLEKLTPNEITSIPIVVENQGNYNDTFNFRVRTESGYPLTLTKNSTITLQPGEQGMALIGVAVPANILDTGTLHSLYIDTYSIEQPNSSIASQRIFIETQGLYFSEQNSIYTIGVGLLILIALILLFSWRRKISEKTGKKPEKPWKILEEQQHLAELKRTDKNAYERERIMMEDEYKSAMQWYKENRKPVQKKQIEKKQKKKPNKILSSLLKKPAVKTKQEKSKNTLSSVVEKPVEKPKKEIVQPIVQSEESMKEKAIERIRKEQEKQLRRLK